MYLPIRAKDLSNEIVEQHCRAISKAFIAGRAFTYISITGIKQEYNQ